jgi:hypothetical protein
MGIDAVFTWVDGSDPDFIKDRDAHASVARRDPVSPVWRAQSQYSGRAELQDRQRHAPPDRVRATSATSMSRFRSNEELRYALRSIEANAPWIDRVFIVTNGQKPAWLDLNNKRIVLVDHADIFPDLSLLPTFNSNAIELNLHRIRGLSDDFLYFNDDFFLGRPVTLSDFMDTDGRYKLFIEYDKPLPLRMSDRSLIGHSWAFNHNLIVSRFGKGKDRRLFAHSPQMYNKQLLQEVELAWFEDCRNTIAHRFRTPFDVAFRILYTYYLALIGKTTYRSMKTPGVLVPLKQDDYRFVKFGDGRTPYMQDLRRVLTDRPKFICINDEIDFGDHEADEAARKVLEASLDELFPQPSAFETASRQPRGYVQPVADISIKLSDLALALTRVTSTTGEAVTVWHKDAQAQYWYEYKVGAPGRSTIRSGEDLLIEAESAHDFFIDCEIVSTAESHEPLRGFDETRRFYTRVSTGDDGLVDVDAILRRYAALWGKIEALESSVAAIQSDGERDPMARFLSADQDIRMGRPSEQTLAKLQSALDGGVDPFWVCHRRALVHLALKDLKAAAGEVNVALGVTPSALPVFLDLSRRLRETGKPLEALAVADGCVQHAPDNLEAVYLRSLIRYQFDAADPEVDKLIMAEHPNLDHIAIWANSRISRRHDDPEIMEVLANRDPDHFGIGLALFRLHAYRGDNLTARVALSRAARGLSDATPLIEAGLREKSVGRADAAMTIFEILKARFPEDERGILHRVEVSLRIGSHDEGTLAEIGRVTQQDRPAVRLLDAWTRIASGDIDGGLAGLDALGETVEESWLRDVTEVELRKSNLAGALALADLARRRFPGPDSTRSWLSIAVEGGRSSPEIERELTKLIADDPDAAAPGDVLLALRYAMKEERHQLIGSTLALTGVDSDRAVQLYELAKQAREAGRKDGARALLTALRDFAPDYLPAALELASNQIDDGSIDGSTRAHLDAYVDGVDDPYWGLYHRVRFHLLQRNLDEVRADVGRVDGDRSPFLWLIRSAAALSEDEKDLLLHNAEASVAEGSDGIVEASARGTDREDADAVSAA